MPFPGGRLLLDFDRRIPLRITFYGLLALSLCIAALEWAREQTFDQIVLESKPIAYYRFEEVEGETITDSSGNGFDALINMNGILRVDGLVGGGIQFSGDGMVVLGLTMNPTDPEGDGLNEGLNDFSIELLIQPNSDAPQQVFVAQMNGTGYGRSNLLITANGQYGSFLGGETTDSDVAPFVGTWNHLIFTYDGGLGWETMRFYINGDLAGTGFLLPESADGNWVLGSHKGGAIQFFTGLLDEVAFYDFRLDDPDGDDDTSDSLVLTHAEAALGTDRPPTLSRSPAQSTAR